MMSAGRRRRFVLATPRATWRDPDLPTADESEQREDPAQTVLALSRQRGPARGMEATQRCGGTALARVHMRPLRHRRPVGNLGGTAMRLAGGGP